MGLQNKVGFKLIKVSATVTRPADTTQYAIGDAITNSTSAPTVFELDLKEFSSLGQEVEICKIAVVSSTKESTLPLINVVLSPTTFTSTNDNSALAIADATIEAGAVFIPCAVTNFTASNSSVEANNLRTPVILASNNTKLFGVMQAANTYTPISGEKFTIIMWARLL